MRNSYGLSTLAKRLPVRGRGFTLAEILIALALMAILAAVLLPTVAGQLLKGDASKVTQDVQAVRSGSEQFLADIHRYPGKYSDLTKLITTTAATHKDILGNVYTASMVNKWKGPYITADTTNAVFQTGFGGVITNVFTQTTNTNGVPYLTVVITGISATDFDKIDEIVDGVPANKTAGLLRFVSAGGIDSTKFLAIPIQ